MSGAGATRAAAPEAAAPAAVLRRGGVAGLLLAARAELAELGWHQGDFVGDAGGVCLLGALRRAAGAHPLEEPDDRTALDLLREAQAELARPLRPSDEVGCSLDPAEVLAAWNDRAGRTAAHVVAHLDAVAADLGDPRLRGGDP